MNDSMALPEEKPIKQVINDLLDSYRISGKMDELRIVNNWSEIVGRLIAKNTLKLQLKGQSLYVYVESAPLKNELSFHRTVLVQKINAFFGKEIVREIIIK